MRFITPLALLVALSACKSEPSPTPAPAKPAEPTKASTPEPTKAAEPTKDPAPAEPTKDPAPAEPTKDPAPAEPTKDPAPVADGSTTYSKDGIKMQVPASWSVTQDEVDTEIAWTRTLHIENQDSGLVILTCFKDLDMTTEAFLTSTIEAMKEAIAPARVEKTGETTTSKATIAGAERDGHTAKYKVILGEIDVPHTAAVYRADLGTNKCIVLTQASDDEIAAYRVPFETILTSLAAAE